MQNGRAWVDENNIDQMAECIYESQIAKNARKLADNIRLLKPDEQKQKLQSFVSGLSHLIQTIGNPEALQVYIVYLRICFMVAGIEPAPSLHIERMEIPERRSYCLSMGAELQRSVRMADPIVEFACFLVSIPIALGSLSMEAIFKGEKQPHDFSGFGGCP
ncbi:MAG: hypothetical protein AAB495_04040 [Patescibacteria group bacterium]